MALKIAKPALTRPSVILPAVTTPLDEARTAFIEGRWSDAHVAYLRALEETPHAPDLYQEIGICLLQMGEREKALIALCRALRYDRRMVGALNAMGITLFDLGYPRAGEAFFKRVLELAPDHPTARKSLLECMRAQQTGSNELPPAVDELVSLARMGRPTIGLCMIVKNEEQYLEGCLESVRGAVDDLVIVDTGSTDTTVEIAQRFGARILHHPWTGNFAEARNVGLDAATTDWTLVLDADERLGAGQVEQLRQLVENETCAGYSLTIDNFVGEESRKGRQVATVFRLFRNRPDVRFEGRIHEQVIVSAQKIGLKTYPSTVHIIHLGYTNTAMESRDKLHRNLELLERQLAEEPTNPYVHYNLGQTLKMMGQLSQAKPRFIEALGRLKENQADTGIPYYANLYFALSDTLRLLKDHQEAKDLLEEGLRIYPDFPDLHFTLGSVHLDQEQYHEAIKCFERCMALAGTVHAGGSDPSVTTYKGEAALGICKARLGRNTEALHHLRIAERDNPQPDADLHTNLGILLGQAGDVPEAIEQFVKALERNPGELRAWVNLATLSYRLGRFEESVAAWDQALELDGGLENGRVMQAEGLIRLGRLERARTRLEEELTVHPESHVAWLNRGFLHLLEDNLEEARAAWSRCGGSPESRALLGLCGVLMAPNGVSMSDLMVLPIARAWGSAIDLMLRSEVTAPVQLILDWLDRTPQVDASWHAAVAHVLLERGYAQESLQRFLAARALKSDDAGIYVGLGEACAALDLKEDAIVMFQQACALAPHAPHPRRRLAQLQA